MEFLDLEQGTQEWLDWKAHHPSSASMDSAIMGVGPYEIKNQAHFAKFLDGDIVIEENQFMKRGSNVEPMVRDEINSQRQVIGGPVCAQDGEYIASLDNWCPHTKHIDEIKVVAGHNSKRWVAAQRGEILEHDYWQICHQVGGGGDVRSASLVVSDAEQHIEIAAPIEKLKEDWVTLKATWEAFFENYEPGKPFHENESERAVVLAKVYIELTNRQAKLKNHVESVKNDLIVLSQGEPMTVGCLTVSKEIIRQGNVDYSKVPELEGVDLEPYRKASSTYQKIEVAK